MPQRIRSILGEGLGELSLAPSGAQVEALTALAQLVVAWGSRINLTGHADAEQVARRLILDAAALQTVLPALSPVADLGSGAGFPGLPMAILSPDRSFVLVEARERRHHFQRHVVRSLALENVVCVRGRFEKLTPRLCALVLAQAVGSRVDLAPMMLRWAQPGGIIAIPGGALGRESGPSPGIKASEIRTYAVPAGGPSRTVWLGRLEAES